MLRANAVYLTSSVLNRRDMPLACRIFLNINILLCPRAEGTSLQQGGASAAGSRSSKGHAGADAMNRVPTFKWLNVPTAGWTQRLEAAHPRAMRVGVNYG